MDSAPDTMPAPAAKLLARFRNLSREDKMQALLQYSKKLEPLPPRFAEMDRSGYEVPECMTPVALFPEYSGGKMYYYAEVNVRQSPTVAAFLAILFSVVNDEPPSTALAIPADFARQVMDNIGLGSREVGLNALVTRVKREAALRGAKEQ